MHRPHQHFNAAEHHDHGKRPPCCVHRQGHPNHGNQRGGPPRRARASSEHRHGADRAGGDRSGGHCLQNHHQAGAHGNAVHGAVVRHSANAARLHGHVVTKGAGGYQQVHLLKSNATMSAHEYPEDPGSQHLIGNNGDDDGGKCKPVRVTHCARERVADRLVAPHGNHRCAHQQHANNGSHAAQLCAM